MSWVQWSAMIAFLSILVSNGCRRALGRNGNIYARPNEAHVSVKNEEKKEKTEHPPPAPTPPKPKASPFGHEASAMVSSPAAPPAPSAALVEPAPRLTCDSFLSKSSDARGGLRRYMGHLERQRAKETLGQCFSSHPLGRPKGK